jgi:UDP-N-acetylmuramyl pentapeptide phosphotransferase/UDP-N-acetylglucosamine-1-phosphate transferase
MIAVFAIPSIVKISHDKKLLDIPNGRTIHSRSTPRLGGLAIFAGFLSALTIFGHLEGGVQYLLAGSSVLFFIGLKDDIVTVSAFKKFFVQVLATSIVLFIGNIRITSFQGLFGIGELDMGMSYIFSLLVVIAVTNALNLIDGLDGLAGSLIFVTLAVLGLFFFLDSSKVYSNYMYVAVCLMGGILGFLRFNFHKAIIFMGDAGSLVCGFIISILTINFIEMKPTGSNPTIALGILFVPLFDTLRIFTIRILQGRSPFSPDKNHIHHRLLAAGLSQLTTVIVLSLIHICIISFVILTSHLGSNFQLLFLVGFSGLLGLILEFLPRLNKPQTIVHEKTVVKSEKFEV